MSKNSISRLSRSYFLLACSVPLIVGCGGGPKGPPVYKTSATVTLDGKAYGPANLVLVPVEAGKKGNSKPSAAGEVGTDGNVTLTTFTRGDGAAAGEYTVTILPSMSGSPETPIPTKYMSAGNSTLKVTVEAKQDNKLTIPLEKNSGGMNAASAVLGNTSKIKQYPSIGMPSTKK